MRKILLLSLIVTAIFIAGCGEQKEIYSFDELQSARIGIYPGSAYELDAKKSFPDAKYIYLDSLSDFMQSLEAGKIDAFIVGRSHYNALKYRGIDNVKCLDQPIEKVSFAFFFQKNLVGENLAEQMNRFLKEIEKSGELDALKQKWFRADASQKYFEKSDLTGENGTLRLGTSANAVPFIYLERGEVTGYEVELFEKFCAAYGYNYTVAVKNFQGILFDLKTNALDVGVNGTEILDSRKQTLIFSNPHYTDDIVVVVRDYNADENFFTAIKNKLVETLVEQDRWQMILEGVGVTVLVIALPTILSTILGFLLYLVYRKQYKIFNKVIDAIGTLLVGLPTIVILLIFYYVIFGSVNINGIIVVIVTFTILSGLNTMLLLKGGEKTIPKGQLEAAMALGFSERQAFIKFILPQIAQNFFPHYQNIVLGFMRGTAIVGYVSVQDLTRMADLIRARTFDAFVPLLIVSVIYLILSQLIMKSTGLFLKYINPKNRNRENILKGVKL